MLTGPELSRCLLCGSAGFPGTSCNTCLLARPALDDSVVAAKCARCRTPLEILSVGPGTGARIFACFTCRWTFLPPRAWSSLFGGGSSVAAEIETRVPIPTIRVDDALPLMACPACGQQMDRARFAATSASTIDVCRFQHGVWVDAGELAKIVTYQPATSDRAAHRDHPEIAAGIIHANREHLGKVRAASSRAPSLIAISLTFAIGIVAILAGLHFIGRDCRNLDPRVEDPDPSH